MMKNIKKIFARTLRKDLTKTEKLVWELLRKRKFMGFKFRRQHVLEGFVLDFYCPELKLGIEIDGRIHLKQKDYDKARQDIIESKGVTIVRVANMEILHEKRSILRTLEQLIESSSTPSPSGRGRLMDSLVIRKRG